jgi:aryl sulfotransferase
VADDAAALLREAREVSAKHISARLSAAGFDDIPDNGALVLRMIPHTGHSPGRLAAVLGITEQQASETVDALMQRGYLKGGGALAGGAALAGGPGRQAVLVTRRGNAAEYTAMNAFKAARWADFAFRPGDIVVSTWPKSGTAWMQTICALLVFQTPDLPAAISELSPWLDYSRISREQVYALLAAQQHRRIIKTHLPLDEIPVDSRATYIVVGRHPLDTALSLFHQNSNKAAAHGGVPPKPPSPHTMRRVQTPVSPREWLLGWIDTDPSPQGDYHYLAEMMRYMSAAWERRPEPNVALVHYDDLSADLAGEMRRLATRLGISVPDDAWPGLVHAATFENMKASPDRFLSTGVVLEDNATFFRHGKSGEGRSLLTDAELGRYHARVAPLAPPGMLAWLHRMDGHASNP